MTRRDTPLSSTVLVQTLNEALVGPAWHGPSVQSALKAVHARQARERTPASGNSIWDLVLHLAYSRHVMANRLLGATSRFPRPLVKSWWPAVPTSREPRQMDDDWERDMQLLRDTHDRLVEVVRRSGARRLRQTRPGKRHTLAQEVLGVALHDAYHTGQIQLLRKLAR